MSAELADPPYPVVKVVFLCPENTKHILGAVGRQVVSVPGEPAGRERIWVEKDLIVETDAEGNHVKLIGACSVCHRRGSRRRPQARWDRVQRLLDASVQFPNGVLTVPFSI